MFKLRLVFLLLIPAAVPACQRYARAPLDLAAHHAAVEGRDPVAAGVVEYANRLAAAGAGPAAYDPADGLTLGEAEVVALFFNPELRLARLKAEVPRVGAAEAGRWEDPELGVDAERIVESVENPWVLAGTLSFTIPLSGRLGVERERAYAELGAAELRALAEERRVLGELRAEWVNWSAVTERAALARRVVADLESLAGDAERLRQAGELGPVDAGLLRVERVNQTAKMRAQEAEAREAELRLKARLGLAPGARVRLRPDVTVPPADAITDDNGMTLAVAGHARVRLARAEYEVAERTLELEIRKQYPDLRIGGGYGTDEGDERVLFGAGLPLPLFNANRRGIAEARASRDVARAAAEAEYEGLMAEAAAARERLRAAREQLAYVERELAPLADRQVDDARRLARIGEFDTLVLLQAIQSAQEAKLAILDARLSAALAAARLQALLEGGGETSAAPTTRKDQQP